MISRRLESTVGSRLIIKSARMILNSGLKVCQMIMMVLGVQLCSFPTFCPVMKITDNWVDGLSNNVVIGISQGLAISYF